MHNDFFSIINKPWLLLDSEELKIYSIYIFILGFVGGIFEDLIGPLAGLILNLILVMYSLAYSFVCLSLEVRRLHDVNKSGWYLLMELIPLVGWIFVLIAFCSNSVEPNKYGKQI